MIEITDFKNKNVLVLGLAKSGTEAAKLLHKLGARVTVNDKQPFEGNKQAQEIEQYGMTVVCGGHPESLVTREVDYVIKNPGIRYDHPLVSKALALHIPVYTEVELAYRISEAEMIGITGSNGKTTTTTYVGKMLQNSRKTPLVAGNIGNVACKVAQNAGPGDELIVELSSFQLMGTDTFAPDIAVLLNFVEAHLDYHGSMEDYTAAKKNVFLNQKPDNYLIYNADDPLVCSAVTEGKAKQVPFSVKNHYENGASLMNGWLTVFGERLIHREEMSLPGEHNIANALAASAAAVLAGADVGHVRQVLKTFKGVEHRLQYIGEKAERKFYNNSKATNVPATVTALQAFQDPVVLIAGGLDRGLSFDGLIPLFSEKVAVLVAYGETKEKLAETAVRAGVSAVTTTETLEEAVDSAYDQSAPGSVILLSPACASWDQFRTFEERGETFTLKVKQIVNSHGA